MISDLNVKKLETEEHMRKKFFNNLRVRKIFPIVTTPSPKHKKMINSTTSKGNILGEKKKKHVLNGKYYQLKRYMT